MEKGLVSVVAPCYNMEKVCGRFIQSIIDQTYRPIELIIVNDGSTDRSEEIILSYKEAMEQSGIQFQYILKENGGLGAAINTGLKYANGEYFCWPDTDDWYEPDSTSVKVEYLNTHPEYAVVTTDAFIFKEENLSAPTGLMAANFPDSNDEGQFWHLLEGKSIFCPGCHMVRTDALFDSLGGKNIFPSRFGQDMQLLLPVYYKYKRAYINQPLYNYVIYQNSHSHYAPNFEKQMRERNGRYEIKKITLASITGMTAEDREKANRIVDVNEAGRRLQIAAEYRKKDLGEEQLRILRSYHACKLSHRLTVKGIDSRIWRKVSSVMTRLGL